jgi:hypothetical protein
LFLPLETFRVPEITNALASMAICCGSRQFSLWSAARSIVGPVGIVAPPQGYALRYGDPLLLSVTATGAPPLSFQWSKDGTPIANAPSNRCQIGAVNLSDAGNYSVLVSNLFSFEDQCGRAGDHSLLSPARRHHRQPPERCVNAARRD